MYFFFILSLTCQNKFHIKVQKQGWPLAVFPFPFTEETEKSKNQEAVETLTMCELQSDACGAAQGWIPDRKRFCEDSDACLASHKVPVGSRRWMSGW